MTTSQGAENNFRLNLSIPTIVMGKVRFPELVDYYYYYFFFLGDAHKRKNHCIVESFINRKIL